MAASVEVGVNLGSAIGSVALAKSNPPEPQYPQETTDLGLDHCDASSRLHGRGMLHSGPRAPPGTESVPHKPRCGEHIPVACGPVVRTF